MGMYRCGGGGGWVLSEPLEGGGWECGGRWESVLLDPPVAYPPDGSPLSPAEHRPYGGGRRHSIINGLLAPEMGDRRGSACTQAALALAMAVLLVVASAAVAQSWRESTDAFWGLGCDISRDRDSGRAQTRAEVCSSACGRTAGCTHCVWFRGTCFFKTGPLGRWDAFVTTVSGTARATVGAMAG